MASTKSDDKYVIKRSRETWSDPAKQLRYADVLKGVGQQTTGHGIPHIQNYRGPLKPACWSFLSFSVFGAMIWHLSLILTQYFDRPISVHIELKPSKQLVFPAVTLCNMNPMKKSAIAGGNPELSKLLNGGSTADSNKRKRRRKRSLDLTCSDPSQIHPASGLCFGLGSPDTVYYNNAGGYKDLCYNQLGGAVAMINTDSKWQFIKNSAIFDGHSEDGYFVGIKKDEWDDVLTVDQSIFNAYATGQPTSSGGNCVVASRSNNHEWYTAKCALQSTSNKKLALCQQLVQCPWSIYYDAVTNENVCYFLFDNDQTMKHSEAINICKSYDRNATLAVLNTPATVNHVFTSGILDSASVNDYWIYLKNMEWGATPVTATWTNWASPQLSTGDCAMAHVDQSHKWTNKNCISSALALCEWRVPGTIPIPTTDPPTTDPPTTDPPTTDPPTTDPPTTDPPTTDPPTTDPPTTDPPTTDPPTTDPSTTDAPTTDPSTTDAPTTDPPTTDPPSTVPPSTVPPSTVPPSTVPPSTVPPSTVPPTTVPPTTDPPTTDPPTTNPPTTDPPTTNPSTTNPPTTNPSTTNPSTTTPSTTNPSTTDPSTTDPSTTDPSTTNPSTTDPSTTDPFTTSKPMTYSSVTTTTTTTLITTTITTTISTTPLPPTTTPLPGATAPPPKFINGSKYPDRIQVRQEFQTQEKAFELIAEMPEEEKAAMGYTPDEFLLDCQYNGYGCYPTSDFYQFYSLIHGNCYMFNSGWNDTRPLIKNEKTGRRYGLKVMINIGQDEYTDQFGEEAGARVVVHPQDRMPFPEDEGVLAKPGLLTSVGVKKVTVTRLPLPYGRGCVSYDPEKIDVSRNVFEELFPVNYSRNACQKTCYQSYVINECGCADPYYPKEGEAFPSPPVSSCDPNNVAQDDCKYDVNRRFMANELDCDCPSGCIDDFFIPKVSTAKWPSDLQVKKLNQTLGSKLPELFYDASDPWKYTRNLLKVEIYYEELNYERVSEKPAYNDFQFISNIGGAIGLWMGFSLMTVFEFIEFLIDLLVLLWIKRKNTKPETDRSNHEAECPPGTRAADEDCSISKTVSPPEDYSREVTDTDIKLESNSRCETSPQQTSSYHVAQTGIGSNVDECMTPVGGE